MKTLMRIFIGWPTKCLEKLWVCWRRGKPLLNTAYSWQSSCGHKPPNKWQNVPFSHLVWKCIAFRLLCHDFYHSVMFCRKSATVLRRKKKQNKTLIYLKWSCQMNQSCEMTWDFPYGRPKCECQKPLPYMHIWSKQCCRFSVWKGFLYGEFSVPLVFLQTDWISVECQCRTGNASGGWLGHYWWTRKKSAFSL